MIRAAMSIGDIPQVHVNALHRIPGARTAAAKMAIREASMLVGRNEPIFDACHVRVADSFARQDSITRHAQAAMAEALAAFIVADLA